MTILDEIKCMAFCLLITLIIKLLYLVVEYLNEKERALISRIMVSTRNALITSVVDIIIIVFAFSRYQKPSYELYLFSMRAVSIWGTIQIIGMYIYLYFIKRKRVPEISRIGLVSSLFPVINLFIIPYMSVEVITGDYIVWVITLLGIACDTVLLIVIYTMYDTNVLEQTISIHEKELSLMSDVHEEAQTDELRLLSLKAEYQNELDNIYRMYCDSYESNDCNEYIDKLKRKIRSTKDCKCYNIIVNTILMEFEERCSTEGIHFNCDVHLGENTGISNLHLCSVFTNMLKNAVEGCIRSGSNEKYIDIVCYQKGNYLNVSVKNSAGDNAKIRTSRKGHGYGLRILEDVAGIYNGKFKCELVNNEFRAVISMLMNNNEGESPKI